MPHDACGSCLIEVELPFEDIGKRLSLTVLDDNKKPVIIFEELVYFGDCKMVDDFQLVNLLFEELTFRASDFVLVDDVDSSGQG